MSFTATMFMDHFFGVSVAGLCWHFSWGCTTSRSERARATGSEARSCFQKKGGTLLYTFCEAVLVLFFFPSSCLVPWLFYVCLYTCVCFFLVGLLILSHKLRIGQLVCEPVCLCFHCAFEKIACPMASRKLEDDVAPA